MRLLGLFIMLAAGLLWLVTLPFAYVHEKCRAVLDPFGEP